MRGEIETGLQEMRGNQATDLARIEADNRLLMQSSASASQFFTQTMESISAILNNPNLTQIQRQAAIDHQLEILNAGLAVIGGVGNIDLSGLVNFSDTGGTTGGTPGSAPGGGSTDGTAGPVFPGTNIPLSSIPVGSTGVFNGQPFIINNTSLDENGFIRIEYPDGSATGLTPQQVLDSMH